MKILLDENVTVQLPLLHTFLQDKGYDVVAQRAIAPSVPDEDVIALATQLGRTIITFDTDFPILKFKHSRSMPFGAILIQEGKDKVRPDDALMTRKLASAIDTIRDRATENPDVLFDMLFTLTQPTPYVQVKIRPKRFKDKKEVVDNLIYMEEQLYADDTGSFTLVPVDHEEQQ